MSLFRCDNGHELHVGGLETIGKPQPISLVFCDKGTKLLCPFCLTDWINKTLPETKEVKEDEA